MTLIIRLLSPKNEGYPIALEKSDINNRWNAAYYRLNVTLQIWFMQNNRTVVCLLLSKCMKKFPVWRIDLDMNHTKEKPIDAEPYKAQINT